MPYIGTEGIRRHPHKRHQQTLADRQEAIRLQAQYQSALDKQNDQIRKVLEDQRDSHAN